MRIADKRRWLDERCAVAPPCRVRREAVWRCNYTCKACRGPRKPPPPPRFRRKQVNWSIGGPDERSYSRTVVGSGAPTSTRCATPIGLTVGPGGSPRCAKLSPPQKRSLVWLSRLLTHSLSAALIPPLPLNSSQCQSWYRRGVGQRERERRSPQSALA